MAHACRSPHCSYLKFQSQWNCDSATLWESGWSQDHLVCSTVLIGPPHCSSSGSYPTLFNNLPLIPYDTPKLDKFLQASTNPMKQFQTILQNFELYRTLSNYFTTLQMPSVMVPLFFLSTSPCFTPISYYHATWQACQTLENQIAHFLECNEAFLDCLDDILGQ